ncbi:hypothetical protein IKF32_01365 [Candidatus Saccharibacteria bacterium]|nr:hypothetical protein [Candidatus Saccharibacteria bacterium]
MLTKTKVIVSSLGIIITTILVASYVPQTNIVSAVTENTTFQVNVKESLSVSITTPSTWAVGDVDTFLRNKITVNVSTNNEYGFVASMTTKTSDTALNHVNNKGTIPTLASNATKSSFPVNRWGYSLNDTDPGNNSSTYSALVGVNGTPIVLISNSQSHTINSRDVYFGAKANSTKASGTYTSTVVISVVTGSAPDNPPVNPTDPAVPDDTEEEPHYNPAPTGGSNGTTTYTYTRTSGSGSTATSTTTTQVSDGDNRNAYVGYTPPQGVTNRSTTTENINGSSSLATGLAVTSAVAATSGTIFFILAQRKKDEEEDEDEEEEL